MSIVNCVSIRRRYPIRENILFLYQQLFVQYLFNIFSFARTNIMHTIIVINNRMVKSDNINDAFLFFFTTLYIYSYHVIV